VVRRAGVTDSEFHTLFATFEECYEAAYEEGVERLSGAVATAAGGEDGWLERVRSGLVALLGFFDDHPSWARLLVRDAPVAASMSLERRQRLQEVLARLLEHRGPANASTGSPSVMPALTGELVVGGVFSVIRSSMLANEGEKLVELAPSLMAFIVASYLGQAAARAELEGSPYGRNNVPVAQPGMSRRRAISRAGELPIRATHRTTLVLRAIAQTPYLNNREVAQAAGLVDEGQASKLLARLESRGVIENVGVGAARGEPNAWLLTASGRRAVELLDEHVVAGTARPRNTRARDTA
jgi:AcrR family transcriptional regulator